MEVCPTCQKQIDSIKLLKCKFCEKNFCSLGCLVKHASTHLGNNDSSINIRNRLKRRQSENLTEQYNFITGGDFKEKTNFDKKYDINNFTKVIEDIFPKQLGSGSFGRVFLVTHNETKKLFALKVIDKRKLLMSYGKLDIIYNEINIHAKLDHENIIKLYNFNEDNENINIVMEYAPNGNLYDLITKTKTGFDEYKAFEYFIQVVNAVHYLHNNNIIHRDIKPENILIGEDNKIKLCDFGWAKELTVNNRSTFCGTMEYMAPEIVGSEKYDFSVDVWSLGILLYELIMGHSPFRSKKDRNIMVKIKIHDLVFDKNKNISKECIDLINGLLDANPVKRLKLKDIFEHPWVINNSKKEKINNYVPRKESLDDSNENIIKFLHKKNNFEKFLNLKKKFGFDKKINLRDKLSSKALFIGEFRSDNKLLSMKDLNKKSIKKESETLEKLYDKMSDELEKGKKKVEDLNFKRGKQFSFEDFRDTELLNDGNQIMEESYEDSKLKEINDGTFNDKSFEFDDNSKDITFEEVKEE